VATQQQKSAEDDVENEEELPTDDAVTESQLEAAATSKSCAEIKETRVAESEEKSVTCEVRNQSLMTLNTVVTVIRAANQTETTAISEATQYAGLRGDSV
jgi:hypothetical protein